MFNINFIIVDPTPNPDPAKAKFAVEDLGS